LEKIKHGFKTLAECGDIRGVDDTSSLKNKYSPEPTGHFKSNLIENVLG
jgi:hypothetical protein